MDEYSLDGVSDEYLLDELQRVDQELNTYQAPSYDSMSDDELRQQLQSVDNELSGMQQPSLGATVLDYADTIPNALTSGLLQAGGSIGSTLQAMEDRAESDAPIYDPTKLNLLGAGDAVVGLLSKAYNAVAPDNLGAGMAEVAKQASQNIREKEGVQKGYFQDLSFKLPEQIARFLPGLATGNIPLGMGFAWQQIFGDKYQEYKDEGLPSEEASRLATLQASAQAPVESMGALGALAKPARTLGGTMGKAMVGEAGEEFAQQVINDSIDALGTDDEFDLKNTVVEGLKSAGYGAMGGGLTAGAFGSSAQARQQRAQQQQIAEAEALLAEIEQENSYPVPVENKPTELPQPVLQPGITPLSQEQIQAAGRAAEKTLNERRRQDQAQVNQEKAELEAFQENLALEQQRQEALSKVEAQQVPDERLVEPLQKEMPPRTDRAALVEDLIPGTPEAQANQIGIDRSLKIYDETVANSPLGYEFRPQEQQGPEPGSRAAFEQKFSENLPVLQEQLPLGVNKQTEQIIATLSQTGRYSPQELQYMRAALERTNQSRQEEFVERGGVVSNQPTLGPKTFDETLTEGVSVYKARENGGLDYFAKEVMRDSEPARQEALKKVDELIANSPLGFAPTEAQKRNSETGAVINPPKVITDFFDNLFYKPKGKKADTGELEEFLSHPLLGGYRRQFIFSETLAQKAPSAKAAIEAGNRYYEDESLNNTIFWESFKTYRELQDTKKVDTMLLAARMASDKGKKFTITPETLKAKGFSEQETKAYFEVLNTNKTVSVDLMREALLRFPPESIRKSLKQANSPETAIAYQEYVNRVEQAMEEFRQRDYVPLFRAGQYYIASDSFNGEKAFWLFESKSERAAKAKELDKQKVKYEYGDLKQYRGDSKETGSGYSGLSLDQLQFLTEKFPEIQLDSGKKDIKAKKSGKPVTGFTKHLRQAKLISGFSTDVKRSLFDYYGGLSRFHASALYQSRFENAMERVSENDIKLREALTETRDYVLSNTEAARRARHFLSFYFLSRPLSAAVNLTQVPLIGLPLLQQEMRGVKGSSVKMLGDSYVDAFSFLLNPEAFGKAKPGLYKYLKSAQARGITGANMTHNMSAGAYSPGGNKSAIQSVSDAGLWAFGNAEILDRTVTYIAGYKAAKAKGIKGKTEYAGEMEDAIDNYAREFTKEVNFLYDKSDRPKIARSTLGSLAFTFKTFSGKQLRLLRNSIDDPATFMKLIGFQMLLGGIFAVPFGDEAEELAKVAGVDPRLEVRKLSYALSKLVGGTEAEMNKFADTLADVTQYGLPFLAGLNLSSSLQAQYTAGLLEQSPEKTFMNLALGPAGGLWQRIQRGAYYYQKGDNNQAILSILPPALQRPLEAAYAHFNEGDWYTPGSLKKLVQREPLLKLDAMDYVSLFVGGTPTGATQYYEKESSKYLIKEKAKSYSIGGKNYQQAGIHALKKAAEARINGDEQAVQAWVGLFDELRTDFIAKRQDAPDLMPDDFNMKTIKRELKAYIEGRDIRAPKRAKPYLDAIDQIHNQSLTSQ